MDKEELLTRLIERSNDLIEAATKLGVAFVGYKSVNHWGGALSALVALKLATGGNLAAGAAGIGVLSLMGLTQIPTGESPYYKRGIVYPTWWPWEKPYSV